MGVPAWLTGITFELKEKKEKMKPLPRSRTDAKRREVEFHTFTHLKRVLGDTGQAVVHGSSRPGVDDDLSDLVRLAQLRGAVWFHDAHQRWTTQTKKHNTVRWAERGGSSVSQVRLESNLLA